MADDWGAIIDKSPNIRTSAPSPDPWGDVQDTDSWGAVEGRSTIHYPPLLQKILDLAIKGDFKAAQKMIDENETQLFLLGYDADKIRALIEDHKKAYAEGKALEGKIKELIRLYTQGKTDAALAIYNGNKLSIDKAVGNLINADNPLGTELKKVLSNLKDAKFVIIIHRASISANPIAKKTEFKFESEGDILNDSKYVARLQEMLSGILGQDGKRYLEAGYKKGVMDESTAIAVVSYANKDLPPNSLEEITAEIAQSSGDTSTISVFWTSEIEKSLEKEYEFYEKGEPLHTLLIQSKLGFQIFLREQDNPISVLLAYLKIKDPSNKDVYGRIESSLPRSNSLTAEEKEALKSDLKHLLEKCREIKFEENILNQVYKGEIKEISYPVYSIRVNRINGNIDALEGEVAAKIESEGKIFKYSSVDAITRLPVAFFKAVYLKNGGTLDSNRQGDQVITPYLTSGDLLILSRELSRGAGLTLHYELYLDIDLIASLEKLQKNNGLSEIQKGLVSKLLAESKKLDKKREIEITLEEKIVLAELMLKVKESDPNLYVQLRKLDISIYSNNPSGIAQEEAKNLEEIATHYKDKKFEYEDLVNLAKDKNNIGIIALLRRIENSKIEGAMDDIREWYAVSPVIPNVGISKPPLYRLTLLKRKYAEEFGIMSRIEELKKIINDEQAKMEEIKGGSSKDKDKELNPHVSKRDSAKAELDAWEKFLCDDRITREFFNWIVDNYLRDNPILTWLYTEAKINWPLRKLNQYLFQGGYTDQTSGKKLDFGQIDSILLSADTVLSKKLSTWNSTGFISLDYGSEGGQNLSIDTAGEVFKVKQALSVLFLLGLNDEGEIHSYPNLSYLGMAAGGQFGIGNPLKISQIKGLLTTFYLDFLGGKYPDKLFEYVTKGTDMERLSRYDIELLVKLLKGIKDDDKMQKMADVLEKTLTNNAAWDQDYLKLDGKIDDQKIEDLIDKLFNALTRINPEEQYLRVGEPSSGKIASPPWYEDTGPWPFSYNFPPLDENFRSLLKNEGHLGKILSGVLDEIKSDPLRAGLEVPAQYISQQIFLRFMMPIYIYLGLPAQYIMGNDQVKAGDIAIAFALWPRVAFIWYRQMFKEIEQENYWTAYAMFIVTNYITTRWGWRGIWGRTLTLDAEAFRLLTKYVPGLELVGKKYPWLSKGIVRHGYENFSQLELIKRISRSDIWDAKTTKIIMEGVNLGLLGPGEIEELLVKTPKGKFERAKKAQKYWNIGLDSPGYAMDFVLNGQIIDKAQEKWKEHDLKKVIGSIKPGEVTKEDIWLAKEFLKKDGNTVFESSQIFTSLAIGQEGVVIPTGQGSLYGLFRLNEFIKSGRLDVFKQEGALKLKVKLNTDGGAIERSLRIKEVVISKGVAEPTIIVTSPSNLVDYDLFEISLVLPEKMLNMKNSEVSAKLQAFKKKIFENPISSLAKTLRADPLKNRIFNKEANNNFIESFDKDVKRIREEARKLRKEYAGKEAKFFKDLKTKVTDFKSGKLDIIKIRAWMSVALYFTDVKIPHEQQIQSLFILSKSGNILQIKTGQGKTIIGGFTALESALKGETVHIVTSNERLVSEGYKETKAFFERFGIRVGRITQDMTKEQKREVYRNCEVIYGADQLIYDAISGEIPRSEIKRERLIVDEIDQKLIEMARTSFTIGGQAMGEMNPIKLILLNKEFKGKWLKSYARAAKLRSEHFDEKTGRLTEAGAEFIIRDAGYLNPEELNRIEKLLLASRIKHLKDIGSDDPLVTKQYRFIAEGNDIKIVNEEGFALPNQRWEGGIDEAIRIVYGLPIEVGHSTLATISFKQFLSLYPKINGFSGTLESDWELIERIYGLKTASLPNSWPEVIIEDSDFILSNEERRKEITIEDKIRVKVNEVLNAIRKKKSDKDYIGEIKAKVIDRTSSRYGDIVEEFYRVLNQNLSSGDAVAKVRVYPPVYVIGSATDMNWAESKLRIIAKDAVNIALEGRPALVSASTERDVERLFQLIEEEIEKIPDNFRRVVGKDQKGKDIVITKEFLKTRLRYLTADNVMKEGDLIINEAGRVGAITVNTTASRGENVPVDKLAIVNMTLDRIKLTAESIKLGGLHVIAVEQDHTMRLTEQKVGRAFRQSDPGSGRLYLHNRDHLFSNLTPEEMKELMELGTKETTVNGLIELDGSTPGRIRIAELIKLCLNRAAEQTYQDISSNNFFADTTWETEKGYWGRFSGIPEENDMIRETIKDTVKSLLDGIGIDGSKEIDSVQIRKLEEALKKLLGTNAVKLEGLFRESDRATVEKVLSQKIIEIFEGRYGHEASYDKKSGIDMWQGKMQEIFMRRYSEYQVKLKDIRTEVLSSWASGEDAKTLENKLKEIFRTRALEAYRQMMDSISKDVLDDVFKKGWVKGTIDRIYRFGRPKLEVTADDISEAREVVKPVKISTAQQLATEKPTIDLSQETIIKIFTDRGITISPNGAFTGEKLETIKEFASIFEKAGIKEVYIEKGIVFRKSNLPKLENELKGRKGVHTLRFEKLENGGFKVIPKLKPYEPSILGGPAASQLEENPELKEKHRIVTEREELRLAKLEEVKLALKDVYGEKLAEEIVREIEKPNLKRLTDIEGKLQEGIRKMSNKEFAELIGEKDVEKATKIKSQLDRYTLKQTGLGLLSITAGFIGMAGLSILLHYIDPDMNPSLHTSIVLLGGHFTNEGIAALIKSMKSKKEFINTLKSLKNIRAIGRGIIYLPQTAGGLIKGMGRGNISAVGWRMAMDTLGVSKDSKLRAYGELGAFFAPDILGLGNDALDEIIGFKLFSKIGEKGVAKVAGKVLSTVGWAAFALDLGAGGAEHLIIKDPYMLTVIAKAKEEWGKAQTGFFAKYGLIAGNALAGSFVDSLIPEKYLDLVERQNGEDISNFLENFGVGLFISIMNVSGLKALIDGPITAETLEPQAKQAFKEYIINFLVSKDEKGREAGKIFFEKTQSLIRLKYGENIPKDLKIIAELNAEDISKIEISDAFISAVLKMGTLDGKSLIGQIKKLNSIKKGGK